VAALMIGAMVIPAAGIALVGYSLGGLVAVHAAALDERVAGVASVCGFTPMRTDTDAKTTGGVRRLWEWHGLLPRLGLFDGREDEIPCDVDDLLELVAPRACLVYAPLRDREADAEDVRACVERAEHAWDDAGSPDGLTLLMPDDINRLQSPQEDAVLRWLEGSVRGKEEG
jgi:pimeloyl-ACP methyl ester carboxylesterase